MARTEPAQLPDVRQHDPAGKGSCVPTKMRWGAAAARHPPPETDPPETGTCSCKSKCATVHSSFMCDSPNARPPKGPSGGDVMKHCCPHAVDTLLSSGKEPTVPKDTCSGVYVSRHNFTGGNGPDHQGEPCVTPRVLTSGKCTAPCGDSNRRPPGDGGGRVVWDGGTTRGQWKRWGVRTDTFTLLTVTMFTDIHVKTCKIVLFKRMQSRLL